MEKEEAAKQELTDLLQMNDTTVSDHKPQKEKAKKQSSKEKDGGNLSNMDKVYDVLKQKNKKLKKEIQEQKNETETLRGIFAEFQVEFKQGKKDQKMFNQLTVSDLEDIFAI